MLARHQQAIVAIATAPGRGAVGIVRVSGRGIDALVQMLCGRALKPREATYLPFRDADGSAIDHGLAIYFAAPHSFTGEDVLELQAHGGPVVLQLLVQRCLQAAASVYAATGKPVLAGLRVAQPGEFSERAFLNDKIDLAQAEAIADLIDASTEAAARSASRSLAGDFSREIGELRDRHRGIVVVDRDDVHLARPDTGIAPEAGGEVGDAGAQAGIEVAQAFDGGVEGAQVLHPGSPGAPTLTLPLPQGWVDEGPAKPEWAWSASKFDDPATKADPPTIVIRGNAWRRRQRRNVNAPYPTPRRSGRRSPSWASASPRC